MAPVYDFRHVELDKIGRGKRIVKPPGGECSDIFGPSPATSPNGDMSTPRKTNKTYMLHSNIFTPPGDALDGPVSPNGSNGSSPGKLLDTAVRLFGDTPENTPRKVVDRQRSSIFEEEVHHDSRPQSLKSTPARRPQINPITGAPVHENGGTPNGSQNGSRNGTPTTNGCFNSNGGTPNGGTPTNGVHSNGGTPNGYANGYSNGHSSPDSPMNGSARFRNPPGGKSSGIF